MEPISAYSNAPTYSLTRLLLAGSSSRSAVLAGAHEENTDRINRASETLPRQSGLQHGAPTDDSGRQSSGHTSPYGPAAIYEPSEQARRPARGPDHGPPRAGEKQPSGEESLGRQELTEEEQKQVEELKERDRAVRRHEQAHKAAAGGHARGGPSFEYETGPDGQQYAVGGEVQIDPAPVEGNPTATIAKMQQLRRAALAPSDPSSQDRAVAAQAARAEREARQELSKQKSGEDAKTGEAGQPPRGSAMTGISGYALTHPGQVLDLVA